MDINYTYIAYMDINDFTFSPPKQINRSNFEAILTSKDGNRFGVIYNSMVPAPNEFIFNEFIKNKNNFFIDIDSEIVKDKIKKEVEIITNSEPIKETVIDKTA